MHKPHFSISCLSGNSASGLASPLPHKGHPPLRGPHLGIEVFQTTHYTLSRAQSGDGSNLHQPSSEAMFRRFRLSVFTGHGLSEDFPDVLSSSSLFSIVPGYYTPDCPDLSTIFSVFSFNPIFLQISVYRDAPMGNASLEGRQLSDSFCLSRFVSAAVKFQFRGESPQTMRYELHRSNSILRAPRPVACSRSAYGTHQISVCRALTIESVGATCGRPKASPSRGGG